MTFSLLASSSSSVCWQTQWSTTYEVQQFHNTSWYTNQTECESLRYHTDQGWQTYGKGKDFLGTQLSLLSHFFFISLCQPATPFCEEYVYRHIPDCVDIVHKLPLLPNSTAIETLLHKSGVEQHVD
jgi:hypothetical protein